MENQAIQIVLLMPLKIEYDAVRKHLKNTAEKFIAGIRYETGIFSGAAQNFHIAIAETGAKNTRMGLAAEKAIQHFQPAVIFLTGIAGGVKDVKKGDLVVATKVYGYDSGKETPEGYFSRPEVVNFDEALLEIAKSVAAKQDWKKQFSQQNQPEVFFGAIASGDKVVATKSSPVYQKIKQHFNDTLALEMEASGFGAALRSHPTTRAMVIRSISDLLDGKSAADASGCQEIAASNAAAFLFGVIERLKIEDLKIMDVKQLAGKVVDELLLLMNKKSEDQLSKPALKIISALYQKTEKVAKAAMEELQEDVTDTDNQAYVRKLLQKAIKTDVDLKNELLHLTKNLEQVRNISGKTISVENSKNIVIESQISAGGNVHIGDQTNYIGQQVNNNGKVGRQINIDENKGDIYM